MTHMRKIILGFNFYYSIFFLNSCLTCSNIWGDFSEDESIRYVVIKKLRQLFEFRRKKITF